MQNGGNFLSEIRDLAIPFGLLLAHSGLKQLIEKSSNGSKSKNVKKSKPSSKKSKKQSGGDCTSCGMLGGSTDKNVSMHNDIQKEFVRVAQQLNTILNAK